MFCAFLGLSLGESSSILGALLISHISFKANQKHPAAIARHTMVDIQSETAFISFMANLSYVWKWNFLLFSSDVREAYELVDVSALLNYRYLLIAF